MVEEETPQPWSHWRLPLTLGGVGLALLLMGYFLLQAPAQVGPRAAEQEQKVKELRAGTDDPELARKLDGIAAQHSRQWASVIGTVAFWAGLLLFIGGVVQLCRQPPPSSEGPPEEGPELPEEEADESFLPD
jgi:hypothetical protein